jgi:2,4-dienoyl-CoA reductase-like NADH-dependent reductase (Old Yellow Enzyme family)
MSLIVDRHTDQVPLAAAIKNTVNMSVRAVGMIVTAKQAEHVIASGAADAVALGRAFIDNPHWPYEAARVLGKGLEYPPQYARAAPQALQGIAMQSAA